MVQAESMDAVERVVIRASSRHFLSHVFSQDPFWKYAL